MKRLTVLTAALAAGLTTFAADAQESPVDAAAAFASASAVKKPAETAPAPSPTLTPIKVTDRGNFGVFSTPVKAKDAAEQIDDMTTASVTKEEAAKDEPKKAAEAEEPKKAAKAKEVEKEAAADKPDAAQAADVPTPEKRPELVATARKFALGKPGDVPTASDRKLIAETKKSAEKKVAALGSGGKYREIVAKYASAYGVPVTLAHAVITIESNYRANARGSAGEIGLMQIKPSTARMMGYTGSAKGLYNPENNIKYGMKYLGKARELGGGTTCGTILKYNAGHGAKRMNPVSSAYCSKVKRHLGSA